MKIKETYGYAAEIVRIYWSAYGKGGALFRSPFLHLSLAIMIPTIPLWTKKDWWELVLNVMPNMLGFSLGGYAILLAFGDTDFLSIISGKSDREKEKGSPFLHINANFFHFILMQFMALIFAVIAKAKIYSILPVALKSSIKHDHSFVYEGAFLLYHLMWFFGFLIFIYAIATGLAATISIFEVGEWYDGYQTGQRKKRSYREGSYISVKSPADCVESEIDAFISLVEKGAEVNSTGLEARVRAAKYLAFVWFQKKLIGVGALKIPNTGYRDQISSKAGVQLPATEMPYELGWIYILEEARGNGFSKDLSERLLRMVNAKGVFSTVRVENIPMRRTLSSLSFEEIGKTYLSNRAKYELQIFVKR